MKTYVIKDPDGKLYLVKTNRVPKNILCELPQGFESESGEWLKEVQVADQQTGELITTVEIDLAKKNAILSQRNKEEQKKILYDQMNSEVLAEMKRVFGTSNSASATAHYETWKEMLDDPSFFSTQGLKSDVAIVDVDGITILINKGDPLDTAGKIRTYASHRVKDAKSYSSWRLSRIQKFRDDVSLL